MPERTPLRAVLARVACNAAGVPAPLSPMKYAIKPATWGVAIEVPEIELVAYKHQSG